MMPDVFAPSATRTSPMHSRLLALLLLLITPPLALGQRNHDITPDDYVTVAMITELAMSPNGSRVAYCDSRWDKADDKRKSDLWVVASDGKSKPMRLTFDRANDRKPKWSRD